MLALLPGEELRWQQPGLRVGSRLAEQADGLQQKKWRRRSAAKFREETSCNKREALAAVHNILPHISFDKRLGFQSRICDGLARLL